LLDTSLAEVLHVVLNKTLLQLFGLVPLFNITQISMMALNTSFSCVQCSHNYPAYM